MNTLKLSRYPIFTFLLLFFTTLVPKVQAQDAFFNDIFERGLPKLEDVSDRYNNHQNLPASAWFGEDKRDNSKRIRELVDEIIAILGISELNEYRQAINELRGDIKSSNTQISEYKREKITAPKEPFLGIHDLKFRVTKTGYERRIDGEREAIAAYTQEIASIREEFADALRDVGLTLTSDQLDMLLSSVIGDDMIDMAIVFNNAKIITLQLEELTQNTNEDPETARRYYGVYKVLLDVLDYMQKSFIADVNERYLPLAQEYMGVASGIIAEAQTAIKQGHGNREILENNIKSNQLTRETAELYRGMLLEQREYVLEINEELQEDILTAANTYSTVELSSNVAALLKTGVSEFEALSGLKAPELLMFENEQMREEFAKLTDRMQVDVIVKVPAAVD